MIAPICHRRPSPSFGRPCSVGKEMSRPILYWCNDIADRIGITFLHYRTYEAVV